MDLNIEHYPNNRTYFINFLNKSIFEFKIDIQESVKGKLKEGEQLTNETALTIFKQIKRKADVLSFLTKPVVALSLTTIMFAISSGTPAPKQALASIAKSIADAITAILFGLTIKLSIDGFMTQISQAYKDQSNKVKEYIAQVEAEVAKKQQMTFTFAR